MNIAQKRHEKLAKELTEFISNDKEKNNDEVIYAHILMCASKIVKFLPETAEEFGLLDFLHKLVEKDALKKLARNIDECVTFLLALEETKRVLKQLHLSTSENITIQ